MDLLDPSLRVVDNLLGTLRYELKLTPIGHSTAKTKKKCVIHISQSNEG